MASQWFYIRGGQQYGPISTNQLKQLPVLGELEPTDLVWKEGMAEWQPASKLTGLFTQPPPASPPPLPVMVTPANATYVNTARTPLGFGEWYQGKFSTTPVVAQVFLWLLYGYLWIPILYLVQRNSGGGNQDPGREKRLKFLQEKWEPVNGEGPAIQFTKDIGISDEGAYIRFDGFAARYSLSKQFPFDTIGIDVGETKVLLTILSLGRDELVLLGEGGTVHYKRGVSISAAESRRRMGELNKAVGTAGKAALATAGIAGIAVLGVGVAAAGVGVATAGVAAAAARCPRCGSVRSGNRCFNCGWYS